MPKKFDDMVSAIKASLKKDNPKMSEEEISQKAYAMATAQWKKSHGGKVPEGIKDWTLLEFYMPIEEKVTEESTGDFIIRGVAINETTTLNNVKYVSEELEKAAITFRNVPILLDHKNEVRNIVGRTTERVNFNAAMKRIDFEGKIMDKGIQEMIKDGRIGSVSIGAKVQDLTEEADGSKKAIGIRGLEISLVAVPGDSQATLAQAIQNSFEIKEAMKVLEEDSAEIELETHTIEKEGTKMAEEVAENKIEATSTVTSETSKVEVVVEKAVEKTEEKAIAETVKADNTEMEAMKAQIAELKELLLKKKEIQEEIKMENKTKGEVTVEKAQELKEIDNHIVEAIGGKNFAIYMDYSKAGNAKLKRLVR